MIVTSPAGEDTLIGGAEASTISRLGGDDIIHAGVGSGTLSGGGGNDTFVEDQGTSLS